MPRSFGPMISASARLCLVYTDRLTAEIPESQFATFARCGEKPVDANHPAFILGHLSLYPCRIVKQLGGDDSKIQPTAHYEELFSPKASCVDDANNSIYPGKEELVGKVRDGYNAAIASLESADDALFSEPNPNEPMRGKFATIGAMHTFYVGGHFMMHMGQMSTWRRMMGMGSA